MSSCPICLEPELKQPAACVPCGHTFCHRCITQWTSSSQRFTISLCPQCRAPVRQVQKLFISDWPVSGTTNTGPPGHLSPWQQLYQAIYIIIHLSITPLINYSIAFVNLVPEWFDRLGQYAEQLLQQLSVWKQRFAEYTGRVWRGWCDLDLGPQCVLVSGVGLAVLLLVEDLSQKDGVHRGVVLPILAVLADALQQMAVVLSFLLYRPLTCLLTCGAEIATAIAEMVSVTAQGAVSIMLDAFSLPWLLVTVGFRLFLNIVAGCMSVLRVCMVISLLAVMMGSDTVPQRVMAWAQCIMDWFQQLQAQHTHTHHADQQQQQQPVQDPDVTTTQHAEPQNNGAAQPQGAAHDELEPILRELPVYLQQSFRAVEAHPRFAPLVNIARNFLRRLAYEDQARHIGQGQGQAQQGQGHAQQDQAQQVQVQQSREAQGHELEGQVPQGQVPQGQTQGRENIGGDERDDSDAQFQHIVMSNFDLIELGGHTRIQIRRRLQPAD